jgi:SARP family transcriptional regulator, regulator of embCAB operon
VKISLLGPPVVYGEDCVTALQPCRRTNLLVLLLSVGGRPVSDESLIAELWPEALPGEPVNALQAQVSRLRQDLVRWRLSPEDFAVTRSGSGYAMDCSSGHVDVIVFEQLVKRASCLLEKAPGEALPLALRARQMWRDEPMAGLNLTTSGQMLRVSLQERHLRLLETLSLCMLALDRCEEAVEELRRLVIVYPFHERFHELLITALFRAGRKNEGIDVYQDLNCRLRQGLGVEPSAWLHSAYTRLLRAGQATPRGSCNPDASTPFHTGEHGS